MKLNEKNRAIALRRKGLSINQIYTLLGVAKGSVSLWVRNIQLSDSQLNELSARGHSKQVIEKRRNTRLTRENHRRKLIVDSAAAEIDSISKRELFLMGLALYWAEGSKTSRGRVQLANADPTLIAVAMKFFRELCKVSEDRFRGHICLHSHLDVHKAEYYWSGISGIPLKQFFKTSQQHNKASTGKRDTLPFGTFSIYVCDTELFLRIQGWTNGIVKALDCEIDKKTGEPLSD